MEYHAQTAVEAALALREDLHHAEGARAVEQLSDVEIGSYDVAIEIIGRDPEKWHPATRETADHSLPYCVARALLDGRMTEHSFSAERLRASAVIQLMKKVRVVRQPEFADRYPAAMPTRVTGRTLSGRSYAKQVDLPLGHPRHPMSDRDVEAKFRRLVAGRVERAKIEKLLESVWTLERCKDIKAVMPLMRARTQ